MPWCPVCRQEYVVTVARCADCDAELVADLSAARAAAGAAVEDGEGSAGVAEGVVRVLGPGAMVAALVPWLEQARVPVRRLADSDGVEIPAAFADRVAAALENSAEIERGAGEIRVIGPPRDREPELPDDPSILERSLDEIAADPAGMVPRVLALFATPAPRARRWARERLLELEARGTVTLADLALWLAREGYRSALRGFAGAFAEAPPPGLCSRVAAELPRLETGALHLALELLGRLPDRSVADRVLPLLRHADPDVRSEADDVLISLSGIDVRFDAEAEPGARERSIQLWREWIERDARG